MLIIRENVKGAVMGVCKIDLNRSELELEVRKTRRSIKSGYFHQRMGEAITLSRYLGRYAKVPMGYEYF
jgi:hypothetical protein